MPELPEVENVCREINQKLGAGQKIEALLFHRPNLRYDLPAELPEKVRGLTFHKATRRAKYLLFDLGQYVLISHLGMSGSWRWTRESERRKHDHCEMKFANGDVLVFHDPRRFGFLDYVQKGNENSSKHLQNLGIEPLTEALTAEQLSQIARNKTTSIRSFLMDQRVVVGVGNIYVSEALYMARVKPARMAKKVQLKEMRAIVLAIQKILMRSIQKGGSTIRDYVRTDGGSGHFQNTLKVYGRDGNPCLRCGTMIRKQTMGGRSSFWCPKCQK